MTEVRYSKVDYCKYKQMEAFLGVCLHTMFGFMMGLFAFVHELDGSVLRWVMVAYGVGSVVFAGYALPKYLLSLKWIMQRSEKELAVIERVDPGTVTINGYAWDLSFWDRNEVVVDCADGVAHMPFRSLREAS